MRSNPASTLIQIEQMICERANVSRLSHDDLTAYYYGEELEGRAKYRNYRAFHNFFNDVESRFGVVFPLSVWDREWKISEFSKYVEKLRNQPWRSMSEGKKQMKREVSFYSATFYFAFLAVATIMSVTAYSSPKESFLGMSVVSRILFSALILFFWQKKLRRVWRLKRQIRLCNKQIDGQKTHKSRLLP